MTPVFFCFCFLLFPAEFGDSFLTVDDGPNFGQLCSFLCGRIFGPILGFISRFNFELGQICVRLSLNRDPFWVRFSRSVRIVFIPNSGPIFGLIWVVFVSVSGPIWGSFTGEFKLFSGPILGSFTPELKLTSGPISRSTWVVFCVHFWSDFGRIHGWI